MMTANEKEAGILHDVSLCLSLICFARIFDLDDVGAILEILRERQIDFGLSESDMDACFKDIKESIVKFQKLT